MKPVLRNTILATLTLGLSFTALMGFAHTASGRPVLAFMGKLIGKKEFCPLGYDRTASIEDREKQRAAILLSRTELPPTTSTSALGFTLGQTSKVDTMAWIASHNGACHSVPASIELECTGAFFSEADGTLWLEFDRGEKLVSARGVEMFKDSNRAWDFYSDIRKSLRAQKTVEAGAPNLSGLAGLLAQSSIVADSRNFSATVRLANMGPQGFALTHNFRSF